MDTEQIIETWEINNRVNLYLLDAIAGEHLADGLTSKGRRVGEQFGHIHNVRLMWLKAAMPEALARQAKVEKEQAGDKARLAASLLQSGEAIAGLLRHVCAGGGRVKGLNVCHRERMEQIVRCSKGRGRDPPPHRPRTTAAAGKGNPGEGNEGSPPLLIRPPST